MSTAPSSSLLWGRKATLILYPPTTTAPGFQGAGSSTANSVDLDNLTTAPLPASPPQALVLEGYPPGQGYNSGPRQGYRFKFDIYSHDQPTPNTATVRVWNLPPSAVKTIMAEYTGVAIQAGYKTGANFGAIFNGTVVTFRRGKENAVDSYLDIEAADGDAAYNFGTAKFSLPAGTTYAQAVAITASQMGLKVDPATLTFLGDIGGITSRGIVGLGLGRAQLNAVAKTTQSRWSIQNGVIKFIPLNGYDPSLDVVVINSATGMVGIPEALDISQGIRVRTLLNPRIQIGQLVELDENDINTTFNTPNAVNFGADNFAVEPTPVTAGKGHYRVMVVNHTGDTRDTPWYTDITALFADLAANPNDITNPDYAQGINSTRGTVQPYGGPLQPYKGTTY